MNCKTTISLQEIAKTLGCSRQAVHQKAQRLGLPVIRHGRWHRLIRSEAEKIWPAIRRTEFLAVSDVQRH